MSTRDHRDFFVTLSSNASGQYFSQNKLTHFWNKLPETIDLRDGDWEVGLAEFQAPYNWLHIQDDDDAGRVFVETTVTQGDILTFYNKTFMLEAGRYKSPQAVITALTKQLRGASEFIKRYVRLTYDKQSHKAKFVLQAGATIEMSGRLMGIFGFNEMADNVEKLINGHYSLKQGIHESQGAMDLFAGLHTLWVYSDIVTHRIVAEELVPLLRILAVEYHTSEDDYKYHAFENIHYLPVRQGLFQSIEIDIRDSQGQAVPFEQGQVIATLHFRKRQRLV